eukprot:4774570-Lingulodinium_polyedra.AAC.1
MWGPSIGATVVRSVLATVTSSPAHSGAVATRVRTRSRQVGHREGIQRPVACAGPTRRGAGVQCGPSVGHMPRSSSA